MATKWLDIGKSLIEKIGRGWFFNLVGILGGLAWYVSSLIIKRTDPALVDVISEVSSDVYIWLAGLFVLGLVITHLDQVSKEGWKYLQPMIVKRVDEVQSQIMKLFKMSRVNECLVRSTDDEIREILPSVYAKAYGAHCLKDDSIAKTLAPRIYVHFDQYKPYRADCSYNIVLTEKPGKRIQWETTQTFRIHCPALDDLPDDRAVDKELLKHCLPFPIKYSTQFKLNGISLKQGLANNQIKVQIDNEVPFDSSRDLYVRGDRVRSRRDGVTAEYKNGVWSCAFRRSYPTEKRIRTVKVHEIALVDDDDTHFILRTSSAINKATINLMPPAGWYIRDVIYPGLEMWEIFYGENKSHIMAQNNGWILPDFVLAIILANKRPK